MLIILARTAILYFLVIMSLRLMGKKQLGELQPSELVITILISNIATISLEDPHIPMLAGVLPIMTLVCLDVIMSAITLKFAGIRRMMTGSPRILIKDGNIDQAEMKNLRYTLDDLLQSMRDGGVFNISEVQYAIAETTGKINFFTKDEPSASPENPPAAIIKDGEVDYNGLKESQLDEKWLRQTLFDNNTTQKDIFLLTADNTGAYFLVRKCLKIKGIIKR